MTFFNQDGRSLFIKRGNDMPSPRDCQWCAEQPPGDQTEVIRVAKDRAVPPDLHWDSRRRLLVRAVFWVLFLCASGGLIAPAQRQTSQRPRDELIAAARETMESTRYCALITADRTGRAQARTMDAFAPDENMNVWMATNPRSSKVAEIRRNPRVTLYYFDRESQAYVTLYGIARLVNGKSEKEKRWKEDWKAFYPDRDKSYLLIKVTPERLEIVDVKKGIFSQSPTWQPPSVRFRR
jgi:general stress protein 26